MEEKEERRREKEEKRAAKQPKKKGRVAPGRALWAYCSRAQLEGRELHQHTGYQGLA